MSVFYKVGEELQEKSNKQQPDMHTIHIGISWQSQYCYNAGFPDLPQYSMPIATG